MSDRRPIHQLPPNLVNRIAAGEVIERPASVVKECVENAIDAGATGVTVEIEDGGKALIRIIDDGTGIMPDELPLAFASHATSKLRDDADLFAISTMGFRGEALASIGSVGFAKITSRVPTSESAYQITNHGGELSSVTAAARPVGTTVEVRDLFYNVPARRKFLKGSATESGHIADAILKIALARPDVSFRLVSGGRVSLDLPATHDPIPRWLAAWPDEYAKSRIEVNADQQDVALRGIVGLPELAMPHTRYQFLFVNGRCVRDKSIAHAMKEAYRGLVEPGRNPAAILMLELPADAVDVNVHPTKSEVRFRDGSRLHGLVLTSIRQALLGNDLTPRAQPRSTFNPTHAEPARESMREQLASFFRADVGTPASSGPGGGHFLPQRPAVPSESHGGASASPSGTSAAASNAPINEAEGEPTFNEGRLASDASVSLNDATSPHTARHATTHSGLMDYGTPPPAIQLHNSYLVVESADGLVIIDQHALHERIMFEDLLSRLQRGALESQRLLLPLTFSASPQQVDALERLAGVFGQLGIEASAIGPEAVAVHAFPSFLSKLDPVAFVKDVLERAENESAQLDHEALLHETLDMMSCKAAVKAGDPLTPQEIQALLERRHLIERASNCPHGRPTTLKLSLRDLEKQFKRTGF
jgi:DNA mismatch repair protein MutL